MLLLGAVQGRTNFGSACYGGAAQLPGKTHRYQFTVHALNIEHLEMLEMNENVEVRCLALTCTFKHWVVLRRSLLQLMTIDPPAP